MGSYIYLETNMCVCVYVCVCVCISHVYVYQNTPATAGDIGDMGSVPGLGRFLGGGHGNPLQFPCVYNPVNRGAWQATVHRVWHNWSDLAGAHTRTCTPQAGVGLLTLISNLALGLQVSFAYMSSFYTHCNFVRQLLISPTSLWLGKLRHSEAREVVWDHTINK